jgi:hypothetical protein
VNEGNARELEIVRKEKIALSWTVFRRAYSLLLEEVSVVALETLYPYWSYVLPGFGLIALYAGGSRKRWGWAVGFTGEMLWIAYGLATRQYGFALSGLAFAIVYARNFLLWHQP